MADYFYIFICIFFLGKIWMTRGRWNYVIFILNINILILHYASMQSEIDETNSLKQCISELKAENFVISRSTKDNYLCILQGRSPCEKVWRFRLIFSRRKKKGYKAYWSIWKFSQLSCKILRYVLPVKFKSYFQMD